MTGVGGGERGEEGTQARPLALTCLVSRFQWVQNLPSALSISRLGTWGGREAEAAADQGGDQTDRQTDSPNQRLSCPVLIRVTTLKAMVS